MTDKSISINRDLVVEILKHLEAIVPSLDHIGSCRDDLSDEEYRLFISEFIEDWSVASRLSYIRRKLSDLILYDDLEHLVADIPSWELNNRKPPKEGT